MNAQADNATTALGMSLDPGKGPSVVNSPDVTTPLPDGWAYFCSRSYRAADGTAFAGGIGRWYATAPWNILNMSSHAQRVLSQTVHAPTWPALHAAVAEQVALHADFAL